MDRLGLGCKGKKLWEMLDQENLSYIQRMSEAMTRMKAVEFKIKVLS